jgi:tetratricopeptide (TPR) repeat protein
MGICDIQTGQFSAAKARLDDCITTDPEFAWLYLLRGFASSTFAARNLAAGKTPTANFEFNLAEADFSQALERLQRAPDQDLQYVLLVNRGLNRFQRGQLDKAAADYNEAIRSRKESSVALAELGHVYQKEGKFAEAIEQFNRAIAIKPDWAPLYRERAKLRRARPDSSPADRAAALDDIKLAIQHEKIDSSVLAVDHTSRGEVLYEDERFDEALEESQLALKIAPSHVDAQVLQVRVLLKLRHYDEAISACDMAVQNGKKSAVLYELRGLAKSRSSDYSGAISDYSRALELSPNDANLLVHRGWSYLFFDSPKPALADFQAAVSIDSKHGEALAGRGMAHARLGDHRAAVADASEAHRFSKPETRATYNVARIYAAAAPLVAADVSEGRMGRVFQSRYEDMAVNLIRQALDQEAPAKRAAFWQETIQHDPALNGIRRRLSYDALIAPNK